MTAPTMQPQYRTVTAAGIAAASMTIVNYLLGHWGVHLPPDVVDASTFIITSGAAWIVHPKVVAVTPEPAS